MKGFITKGSNTTLWLVIVNWGGSVDDSKSTSGYVFNFGFGAVSWA